MMDGHRPALWLSDRYAAQQGHGVAHQTCLEGHGVGPPDLSGASGP